METFPFRAHCDQRREGEARVVNLPTGYGETKPVNDTIGDNFMETEVRGNMWDQSQIPTNHMQGTPSNQSAGFK